MTNAIEVHDITKRYGDFVAVDSVSFEVHQGEIFAMLGPNGAGKTTTIRMILDIFKPDRGKIAVLGGPFSDATKQRIGYLPEERGLYKNVGLVELLTYLGMLKGMKRADAAQRSAELLDMLDLGAYKKGKVRELSRGMSQKVQFAATIIHRPELIVIDEPFAGLDPVNTEKLKEMIYRLRDSGTTVVMSIHEMHQVEEMANRLMMINRGKLVLYGEVDEVRQRYAENAVIVSGTGDWAALPGVIEVVPDETGRNVTLKLDANTTPEQIMSILATAPNYHIRSFARAVPRLTDIFIRVAGGETTPEVKEVNREPAKSLANR
ncbi:MAG: ATP-binding cassette domain-containing protein [Anaerolineae bacterium]